MKKYVGLTIIILIQTLQPGFLIPLDPDVNIQDYIHDVWRVEEGLPQNSVRAIVQTQDGYLWFGTQEGLVRFDGIRFKIFDRGNTEAIKNSHVTTLIEDQDKNLWIGTWGSGVIKYRNGIFTPYTETHGLSNNIVRALHEDRERNIWIGTWGGGLDRLKHGTIKSYGEKNGFPYRYVLSIFEDRAENLWIGTWGDGLIRCRDGQFTAFTTKDGLFSNTVMSIYEDRKGNLWIGTEGGGLNRLRNGEFTTFSSEELIGNHILSIFEDREGNLWIGTWGGGLNRFKNGRFTSFTSKDGLFSDIIRTTYEDREGSLWVGTSGGGLSRLLDSKFKTYTKREGLSSNIIRTFYEESDGSMWIGTAGGGLSCLKNNRCITYSTKQGLSNNIVRTICKDRKGNLWIGTYGGGLNRFKRGKFTVFTTKHGLASNYILFVHEDREGTLWIGTWGSGLNRLRNGIFTTYTTKDGLSSNNVMAIYEESDGTLWIGTGGGGVNRFKNGKFTVYSTKEGLSGNYVFCIYGDKEGTLWIGTYYDGLTRLKDGTFTVYTTKEGLFNNIIYQILEDGNKNLWMSCNKGIFKVSKEELEDFANGRINSIHCTSYGKADGMKSCECNGSNQPAGWKSRDGRLWFPTVEGAAVIDPENINTNTIVPPVKIEKIKIDDQLLEPVNHMEISPGKKRFEFHYTALSFVAPRKVKFKYKLEGFEEDWVDVGAPAERIAYYTNLSPGSYRFRVIACNNDGVWNNKGASFHFFLQPFFYQTYWFYGLCSLAIILIAVGIHLLRVRQIIIRERKKYEKSRISPEQAEKYLKKLVHFMETEKPYLDPNISLHGLSENLKIPDHYISQVINTKLKLNFYDFINKYRIEEAKLIFTNPKQNHLTVLEVAIEVGFNSKSAFNRAFKKATQKTPSEFKKNYLNLEKSPKKVLPFKSGRF